MCGLGGEQLRWRLVAVQHSAAAVVSKLQFVRQPRRRRPPQQPHTPVRLRHYHSQVLQHVPDFDKTTVVFSKSSLLVLPLVLVLVSRHFQTTLGRSWSWSGKTGSAYVTAFLSRHCLMSQNYFLYVLLLAPTGVTMIIAICLLLKCFSLCQPWCR